MGGLFPLLQSTLQLPPASSNFLFPLESYFTRLDGGGCCQEEVGDRGRGTVCHTIFWSSLLLTFAEVQGRKQHKHKLYLNFLRTFLTLTPGCPRTKKKFLPPTGPAGNTHFLVWTSTIFLVRTSMTRRVLQKLCPEKFALIFWSLEVHVGREQRAPPPPDRSGYSIVSFCVCLSVYLSLSLSFYCFFFSLSLSLSLSLSPPLSLSLSLCLSASLSLSLGKRRARKWAGRGAGRNSGRRGVWRTLRSCPDLPLSNSGSFQQCVKRCIVKGEAQKSPRFWRFSGGLWFSQERLFSRNSTRKPLNWMKAPIFANTLGKSTCLYNATGLHIVYHFSTPNLRVCRFYFLSLGQKERVGLFYLRVGLFYLRLVFCCLQSIGLVFFTYGWISVWSFWLTVEIGLVFFTYGGKSVWSFYLQFGLFTCGCPPPRPEIRSGLFCLRFPPARKLGLVFLAYDSHAVSKKDEP